MNKQTYLRLFAVAVMCGCFPGPMFAQASGDYKPIHRSLFLSSELDRNPFCPIGWVKPGQVTAAPTTEATEVVADLRPEDYILTATLLGRPPMVVINGREYAEGDFLLLAPGGQKSKVQVQQVLDGKAILRFMNKEYAILLQRRGEQTIKKLGADGLPLPPKP